MDGKRYRIQGANTLSLPAEDAESSSRSATGSARRYLLFCAPAACSTAAGRALSRTGEQITAAARRLSGAGLLTAGDVPLPGPDELPVYRTEDILRRGADDRGVPRAARRVSAHCSGHTLSSADLNTLFGIYDRLGMTAGDDTLLIHHCADKLRRRYEEGRLPTMRAIEKEAFYWASREILTAPQARNISPRSPGATRRWKRSATRSHSRDAT